MMELLGYAPALQALALAQAEVLAMGLMIAVIVGIVYLRSPRVAGVVLPVVAASFIRLFVGNISPVVVASGIMIAVMDPGILDTNQSLFPIPTSMAFRAGMAVGAYYCVQYFWEVSLCFGLPPEGNEDAQLRIARFFRVQIAILSGMTMLAAAYLPGIELLPLPVLAAGFLYWFYVLALTKRKAELAFYNSPRLERIDTLGLASAEPFGLHATDVHCTHRDTRTLEGGPAGNERLGRLVDRARFHQVAWLAITGDLTDSGHPGEYKEVLEILAPLKHGGNTKVFFAPGNHDLGSAYSFVDRRRRFVSLLLYGPGPMVVDGLLLQRYLETASALNPQLKDSSGTLLKTRLDRLKGRENRFAKAIRDARKGRHRGRLARSKIMTRVEAVGDECFPDSRPTGGWKVFVRYPKAFRMTFLKNWYVLMWSDLFPLSETLSNGTVKVYVLNSNPPNCTMGGSALGEIDAPQMRRFKEALGRDLRRTRRLRRVVVLVHHSPMRWHDELPPKFSMGDLQRWGFLALGNGEGREFLDLLGKVAETGKEVLVLCGHRHGYGRVESQNCDSREARISLHANVLIGEGASLADAETQALVAVHDQGSLALRTLDLG